MDGLTGLEMIANLLQMSPIDQREVFFEVCHSVPSGVTLMGSLLKNISSNNNYSF